MKQIKALLALLALTFGIGAYASGEGYTAGVENFDSLDAGELDVTSVRGDLTTSVWASWTQGEDQLTVTAYGDSTTDKTTEATGTQTNYLKIDTALNNGITFAANGLTETVEGSTYTYEPTPLKVTDSDQVYFDSLVNLSAGDADALAAVTMPDDGRLALWIQAVEVETEVAGEDDEVKTETTEINQLCIRAGKITDADTNFNTVYTANVEKVTAGWHRLTVRLFTNAARSGAAVPAMAIYLDNVAVAAADVDVPMSGAVLNRLTPKCKALATDNALFPSMRQDVDVTLGDVRGIQFSGSGSVDDLIFTTARPRFINAEDDVNYFNLTWDATSTASISYTIGDSSAVSLNVSDEAADIPLTDVGATMIAVTVVCSGDNALDAVEIQKGVSGVESVSVEGNVVTFTIESGNFTPSGAIMTASTKTVATATVTIGGTAGDPITATSLGALVDAINEALSSDGSLPASASVYIKLLEDQSVELSMDGSEVAGELFMGTSDAETYEPVTSIVWTLDLNGKTVTASGTVDADSTVNLIYNDGALVITDTSTDADGLISLGTMSGYCVNNRGVLTVNNGTFDGRVTNDSEIESVEATFNGGKYLIGDDTDSTYLAFLNQHKGEGVTAFVADDETNPKYYVVSGAEPVETYTVTFVNEKAETQSTEVPVESGKTVSAPDPEPTAENFIFLGWYLTTDGQLDADAFDFENTKIEANITLTAKWAAVVAKIGEDGYATIQDALDAAVESATAENEVQVDVVADVEVSESLTLTGSGIDATKIAVNVAENINVTITASYGMYVDGATVTLGGEGTWTKATQGTLFCVGEKSAAANLVMDGASIVATLDSDGDSGPNKLINVMNGTVTVKSGLLQNPCTYGSCIRLENSDVTGVDVGACAVVEGGTLSVPTTGSLAPVVIKDGSSTERNTIYILATGTAKFAGPEKLIVGDDAMEDYLAVANEGADGYDYTADYKFVKGTENDYYTIKAITWATVTVTWDSNVKTFTAVAKGSDDEEESYPMPTDADSMSDSFDVDDKVTFSISKDNITFEDGFELDEDKSVLTAGPMTSGTETYTLYIAAKAITPAYDPVDPEVENICNDEATAEALAAAINANKATLINAPDDAKDLADFDRTAYGDLFVATASASTTESGKWTVTVDLTPDAKSTIKGQVEANSKFELSKLATAAQSATLDTTPGIYYSVVAGGTLGEMKVRSCTMATDKELTVTLPHYDGAGFYQIEATVKAQTVE